MQTNESTLSLLEAAAALPGAKDGSGIGQFLDSHTIDTWVKDYLGGRASANELEAPFRFGVLAEERFAGQSFVEAEAEIRSEWSAEVGQTPWADVRDAVWSGFDRAREHRV
jgi:hypothetical protein